MVIRALRSPHAKTNWKVLDYGLCAIGNLASIDVDNQIGLGEVSSSVYNVIRLGELGACAGGVLGRVG